MCPLPVRRMVWGVLVVLCCTFPGAEGSPAGSNVQVTENVSEGGQSEYVLENAFLRVRVQPGRGGRVLVMGSGTKGQPGRATVLEDSLGGRICHYSSDYAVQSPSLGVVSLRFQGLGVRIRKTYSLLQHESALRVQYRVENRSGLRKHLEAGSVFRTAADESSTAAGLGNEGVSRWTGRELRGDASASWNNPRWLSFIGQGNRRGYVLAPGPGVWAEAGLADGEAQGEFELTTRSVEIPPDARMLADVRLIRVKGLSSVSSVQQGLVTDMSAETAGRTARLDISLYPFRPVDMTGLELNIRDGTGQQLSKLRRDGVGLAAGQVTELSFYWRAPQPGWYGLAMNALQEKGPGPLLESRLAVPGSSLQVNVPDLGSPTITRVRGRRGKLEDIPKPAESRANFHYRSGEPLFSLDLNLAREEKETAVFTVEFPETEGLLSFDIDSSLSTESGTVIPETNYEMVQVSGKAGQADRGTGSRLALRVSAADCEAGTYEGRAIFQCGEERALLPITVRVWPVTRPRPGPVRLHAYPVRLTPGETGSSAAGWQGLQRQRNTLVSCEGKGLWAEPWMTLLQAGRLGIDTPSGAEVNGDRLPTLDFSRVGDQIEPLVLLGVGEFAAVLDLTRPRPGGSALGWGRFSAGRLNKLRWFWLEFSSYMKSKAMRNLYVTSPWPLAANDVTPRWLSKAFAVADSGWSVCGPYRESGVSKLTIPRLANLTDLALMTRDSLASHPELARRLSRSGNLEAGMFLSPSPDTEIGAFLEKLRAAWTPSVSVVAVGPLTADTNHGLSSGSALRPDTVKWEEMLDALDIRNFSVLLQNLKQNKKGDNI